MNRIKIGELSQLVPYMTEVKISYDAVFFRGVYPDAVTGTAEPFFIGRELSALSADERANLFELVLPNGEVFGDVYLKLKTYYKDNDNLLTFSPDERLRHMAINSTHANCKYYGGLCRYCFKNKQVITELVKCKYFEQKIKEKGGKEDVKHATISENIKRLFREN